MAEPMRALSIKQPWLHAIVNGTKRVENRHWAPPQWAIGATIGLAASKRFDWDAQFPAGNIAQWAAPDRVPLGAVVAVARIAAAHDPAAPCGTSQAHGHRACSPWALPGQWHWVLAEVRALADPVPCRGMLGLWRLPEDVEKAVREQLRDVAATQGSENRP